MKKKRREKILEKHSITSIFVLHTDIYGHGIARTIRFNFSIFSSKYTHSSSRKKCFSFHKNVRFSFKYSTKKDTIPVFWRHWVWDWNFYNFYFHGFSKYMPIERYTAMHENYFVISMPNSRYADVYRYVFHEFVAPKSN